MTAAYSIVDERKTCAICGVSFLPACFYDYAKWFVDDCTFCRMHEREKQKERRREAKLLRAQGLNRCKCCNEVKRIESDFYITHATVCNQCRSARKKVVSERAPSTNPIDGFQVGYNRAIGCGQRDPEWISLMQTLRQTVSAAATAPYKLYSRQFFVLGCTHEQYRRHLEAQFAEGMSWGNRGEWHIDHIVPLASAQSEEDILRLNHYTNLRPLWAKDNLRKGARIDYII